MAIPPGNGAAAEFERIYRAQVDAVTAFFARRSADPQTVADLDRYQHTRQDNQPRASR